MLRSRVLTAISVGALILTATPAVSAAASTTSTDSAFEVKPPPGLVDAMERDLGITEEQALTRLSNEDKGNTTAPGLQKQLGEGYAGAWYEGPEATLVVATVDKAHAKAISRTGAQVRVVPRSLKQLSDIKDGLDQVAAPETVYGWGITPQDNSVTVEAADPAAALEWVKTTGVDAAAVKVVQGAERPKLYAEIRGGDAYYIPSKGYRCSIGFAARRGTQLGFTTAGHCGDNGDATNGANQQAQGTFQIDSFPGDDYAWVAVNANWTAAGVVNGYSAGIIPVNGSTVTQVGGSICRSGSTTQWRCGTVGAFNQTVNYAEGTVRELTRTNVCAEGGDSGGSFISGSQAQGMTSGGSGNCRTGGTTYFQPLNELLSKGGLTLVTSSGPPPTGCSTYRERFNGSLTSGQNQYQPSTSGYTTTASGTHAVCLDGPNGVDFDAYLQRWNGSSWSVVASGTSANPDESFSYNGAAGTYRVRVHAYSGSGAYTLGLNRP